MRRLAKIATIVAGLLLCGTAFSQTQKFGAWNVQVNGGLGEAFTTNPSGSTFGLLCTSGFSDCRAYVDVVNLRCEDGTTYPALFSATEGATAIEISCYLLKTKARTRYVYLISTDLMLSALKSKKQVGFAFPLASTGDFQAVRFSVDGAQEAALSLRDALGNGQKPDSRF